MNQQTWQGVKEERNEEHSGHQWSTQPIGSSRGNFFARLMAKNSKNQSKEGAVAIPSPSDQAPSCDTPSLRPMPRSPSMPNLKDIERAPVFSFPFKEEGSDDLRRKLSVDFRSPPVAPLNSVRQHPGSPIPQPLSCRGATPMAKFMSLSKGNSGQSSLIHSSGRTPLQSINPLNHREVMQHSNPAVKGINFGQVDKENIGFSFNKELPPYDPTPDVKKDIIKSMMEDDSPRLCVGSKRMFTSSSSRSLFQSEGNSSTFPENSDSRHKDTSETNEFSNSANKTAQSIPSRVNTPITVRKAPENFVFKEPILPQQKNKVPGEGLIMVKNLLYRKGVKLGKGGSSTVYEVFRVDDNMPFALKIVELNDTVESIKQGFLDEIQILDKMRGCEMVIQLIDFEYREDEDILYVVLEKGVGDLSKFLRKAKEKKSLRLSTIEAFWRDMVNAVALIHEKGIIHSDLKLANFVLCGEVGFHQLKLIDFGIASALSFEQTSVIKDSPAGTFNYMSPEVSKGEKINYKSDIWSLGCILYCLLYGKTPFQDITNWQMKKSVIEDEHHVIQFPKTSPNLPRDACVIPRPLLETVQRCLSYRPADRPSARELLETKYCGCDKQIEFLAQGLAELVKMHPQSRQLAPLLMAALQRDAR
ncbi:Hypothetical predicted protein [Cloeon dipterum]|uniref:Protein kinase domain-containing protein n=1 Tax=Cloeon dipterum TaxID=197152 RepID=A0A8S1DWL3_9INSE|nr:Hypothetical predicted protein [Cloeon dipterum]